MSAKMVYIFIIFNLLAILNFSNGDPLILTDLIKGGQIEEAQKQARVNFDEYFGVESYSGFLTVDKVYNSNLFFWFFPSESVPATDPVILWLQGGPGSSSMFGLFLEHGPFNINLTLGIEKREFYWSKSHSVLYIDQPAGTGFSFTDKDGYAKNQTKVADDLYEALNQFFTLFPNFKTNNFFIIGEDYAGKYIPSISYKILKSNPTADLKINLQGLAIGNGWIAPEEQLTYSDYLYHQGLIDRNGKKSMEYLENKALEAIKRKDFVAAYAFIAEETTSIFSDFNAHTGYQNFYNLMDPYQTVHEIDDLANYFQRTDVRDAIHVDNVKFNHMLNNYYRDASAVFSNLEEDYTKSVAHLLPELLDNYRMLFFSGQFDMVAPYELLIKFLEKLNFSAADEYQTALRKLYGETGALAGYLKTAGNLTEVLIRNAGHFLPIDQPEWTYKLINEFVRDLLPH